MNDPSKGPDFDWKNPPEPPRRIKDDPSKLRLWIDYWEDVLSKVKDEEDQDKRDRRKK